VSAEKMLHYILTRNSLGQKNIHPNIKNMKLPLKIPPIFIEIKFSLNKN